MLFHNNDCRQLFRERLPYLRDNVESYYMGNATFYGCLIEPRSVLAWWKETAETRVFLLTRSLSLNHLEPAQSSKTKLLLPMMPIDIVAYAFTLLWDNLGRNSCTLRKPRDFRKVVFLMYFPFLWIVQSLFNYFSSVSLQGYAIMLFQVRAFFYRCILSCHRLFLFPQDLYLPIFGPQEKLRQYLFFAH